ncbi:uncharacterized protein LOC105914961 [Setaria italica]|uniref:uncharacterized protein LOC105914961 n=1 Tax=Setaria italica TaxID=4555 RepID=UPI00064639D7|nr:uncharacterized protein LOC105914961 [Setaria italica]XP_034569888.1 uncharacterized protein LOC117834407 [Setaria viridis]
MSTSNNSDFNLQSVLDKKKLNGANFIDWYRNLRIVLRKEEIDYVLEPPYPDDPPTDANVVAHRAYQKHLDAALNVSYLLLATMSPNLQKQYELVDAHTMIEELRRMFENQAKTEKYNISKSLFACKLDEGSPLSPHVIKMIGYIETLEKLVLNSRMI